METYEELQTELGSRLMVADNSTLYTTTRKQSLLKDAILWAYGYHEWPEKVRAKTTSTGASQDYYDYPVEFLTDSITKVVIDDTEYHKKDFHDFLEFKKSNASALQTISAGSGNLDVWGLIQPELPTQNSDNTIFSLHAAEGNEAIVKKALSVATAKINKSLSVQEEAEAKIILDKLWQPVAQRQQHKKRLNHPFFNVPDFFGKTSYFDSQETDKYIFADYQRKIFIASFR